MNFAFAIGDKVELVESREAGTVVGRSEFAHEKPSYYVRYVTKDGRQVKNWWNADDMNPAS